MRTFTRQQYLLYAPRKSEHIAKIKRTIAKIKQTQVKTTATNTHSYMCCFFVCFTFAVFFALKSYFAGDPPG